MTLMAQVKAGRLVLDKATDPARRNRGRAARSIPGTVIIRALWGPLVASLVRGPGDVAVL